jgi:hypothetical protein
MAPERTAPETVTPLRRVSLLTLSTYTKAVGLVYLGGHNLYSQTCLKGNSSEQ